jgi:DNA-binding CsgD family transcriptional regulator
MDVYSGGLYFIFLSISLAAIYISYKLAGRYRCKFLDYYLYYLIFYYVYGVINFIGKLLVSQISSGSGDSFVLTSLIISAFSAPAIVASLYMMIYWVREILEKRVSGTFKTAYWLVQALILVFLFMGIKIFVDTKDLQLAKLVFEPLEIVLLSILILGIAHLILNAGDLANKRKRKLAKNLGFLHFIGRVVFFAALYIPLPFYKSNFIFYSFITFLYLSIELIPLLYLKWFLGRYYAKLDFHPVKADGMSRFFPEYKMTEREQSIIRLIIKGKTNEEIGDELFISTKTVKNNISGIYRKARVKNRVQLTNLIRDF